MGVLTLEDLQKMKDDGIEINIPGFDGGEITVKVKSIDISAELLNKASTLYNLAQSDVVEKFKKKNTKGNSPNIMQTEEEIKNQLLQNPEEENIELLNKMLPEMEKVCEEILIQPTYKQFKENCPLNIEQKTALFGWACRGTKKNKRTNKKQ